MWAFFTALRSSSDKNPPGRRGKRRDARFDTDLLATEIGPVVNVSGSGMRVRCDGPAPVTVGQELPLSVGSSASRVDVRCRVVRIKRDGRRGPTDISFAFVGAGATLRAQIEHLGRLGFIPPSAGSGAGAKSNAGAAKPRKPRKPVPDYYQVLGVTPEASADEIRRAYHKLAHQRHPDASRDAASGEAFVSIAEAYRVLRDPAKRRGYDELRVRSLNAA